MTESRDQLRALAAHLREARAKILQSWQDSESHDPELTTASVLSRAQFNDHIPQLLDAFEHRLQAEDPDEKREARREQRENASEHGLHRWQQGFALRETMREWGHLHLCLLRELESYAREHPTLEGSVMPTARRALARLCAEGVCESATHYTQLQQVEAASRVRDLEQTLAALTTFERQRTRMWREAAHDLRGSVSVISNASMLLSRQDVEEGVRTQISDALGRSATSMRELLTDLIDLGRLEAGQEQRNVEAFDAAEELKELCEFLRPLASERNLFLKCQGPASLPVEGDAVKIRRIVQNLVLNALKATAVGGVQVIWKDREQAGKKQWMACVQDTGPGFDPADAGPLQRVLKAATVASHEMELQASLRGEEIAPEAAPTLDSESNRESATATPGEGIGLSIVKRLCELLDASLELETAPGAGTTFRVIFPRDYGPTHPIAAGAPAQS